MTLPKGLMKRGEIFYVRYTVPKSLIDSVGKKSVTRSLNTRSLQEAKGLRVAALRQIKEEIEGGYIRNPSPKQKTIRVRQAANEWLREADGVSATTRQRYERHLESFAMWSENIEVNKINRDLGLKYYDHLRTKKSDRTGHQLSPKTIDTALKCLSSFWRVLDHKEQVPNDMRNPFTGLNRRLPGQKRQVDTRDKQLRPVTREEVTALLKSIMGKPSKYQFEMSLIVPILWSTAARLNEICSLFVSDVEDNCDHVILHVHDAKTQAGNRLLFLSAPEDISRIRSAVTRASMTDPVDHRNDGMLFPRLQRGGYDMRAAQYVGKALERHRKDLEGYDGTWDMHSTRRAGVSALVNADVSKALRCIAVGHNVDEDIGVSVYAKRGDLSDALRDTFSVLVDALGGPLPLD